MPCCGYLICSPDQDLQNCGSGFLKKCLKKNFLTLKVGNWWDCLILTPWERSNLSQKFRWKLFFKKHFYVHWMNAHMFCIIQRLWKTSKIVFQSVISTWKESTWYENSSKISEKFQIGVRNFDEIFFSSKFFWSFIAM